MNHASFEKPRRGAAARVAAATAAVLGATLLAYPGGTASAQTVDAESAPYDYNGDGLNDLMVVRKSDGALMFFAGKGDEFGNLSPGVAKGTGWAGKDVVMAGDLTGDGNADLLARDAKTGTLYTYPGDGSGGVGTRITVGTGWNAMGVFTSGRDFDSDGDVDLYAVDKADGKLYFYPGTGDGGGTFGPRTAVGTGWGVMDSINSVGDLHGDGKADLLAHDSRTGRYYLYKGDGAGNLGSRVAVSPSIYGSTSARYNQIMAVGDQNGDGKEDFATVAARTGYLGFHSINADGTAVRSPWGSASGWGAYRLAAVNEERTYDYNGDGKSDVLVRRASDGKLYFYSGNGSNGFGPIGSWGTDLANMKLIETAGDLNGDGLADVIARTGSLYGLPGNGDGTYDYDARDRIVTGWSTVSAIATGHDYSGDGIVDVIARDKSTGDLWLYRGRGNGRLNLHEVLIGTGWNQFRDITAAGDLDHDGHADLLAVKASDNCMYFFGGRSDSTLGRGTLKPAVQVGCGWSTMDNVAAVGDFDRDGHADWIARRKSDGRVYLYKGDGKGDYSGTAVIATGWTWANAIA